MRRVRDIILRADASMRERVQYGITFSSTKSGDFGAFVRYRDRGVNLHLHRGSRLKGRYAHLEGGTVKRIRFADLKEANARAAELRAMVREWCDLGNDARAGGRSRRSAPSSPTRSARR